ncbi:MAG: hypothetical protein ACK5MX_06450 [Pseudanabaena sp.]
MIDRRSATDVTWKKFLLCPSFCAGTGAQPIQDLKLTGKGNPTVVALVMLAA